jgi:hypothetical protein
VIRGSEAEVVEEDGLGEEEELLLLGVGAPALEEFIIPGEGGEETPRVSWDNTPFFILQ